MRDQKAPLHEPLRAIPCLIPLEPMVGEDGRIQFLLQRDGLDATVAWVWRTLRIYRAAVLDERHHASSDGFRRGYIQSYRDFKRWLAPMHQARHRTDHRRVRRAAPTAH